MVWSENARFYVLGAICFAAAGYVMLRKDYLGPAILAFSTATCAAVVAAPRGN